MRHLLGTNSRRTPRATETSASKTSNRQTSDAERSRLQSKVKQRTVTTHFKTGKLNRRNRLLWIIVAALPPILQSSAVEKLQKKDALVNLVEGDIRVQYNNTNVRAIYIQQVSFCVCVCVFGAVWPYVLCHCKVRTTLKNQHINTLYSHHSLITSAEPCRLHTHDFTSVTPSASDEVLEEGWMMGIP